MIYFVIIINKIFLYTLLILLGFFFLKSKDDIDILLLVGNLAENDNLDINSRSMTSETLYSSKKSPNYNRKRVQEECLSTDGRGGVQDTTKR